MNRTQKSEAVTAYTKAFNEAETVVVTHYSGLTVAQITDLRRKLRAAGADFRVTKNKLAQIALKGTRFEPVNDLFTGPTAIATSSDPIVAAKVIYDYSKENEKLIIVGGAMGETRLDQKGVEALAKLPSLDELRGKLLSLFITPATRIATVAQAPATQVARVISAYAQKG